MKTKKTCFLIDDDIDDQAIFALALDEVEMPVRFVVANNGIEALEKLRTNESFVPDFIFLDLNMPRMHGRECLAEIKKIDRLEDVPVIIYSTSSDPRDVVETKQLGAAEYIVKPSSVSTLSELLKGIFKGGRESSSS
jgi:CheY-like chemotaxis protein